MGANDRHPGGARVRSRVRPGNRVAVEIRRDPANSATRESTDLIGIRARRAPQIRSSGSGIGAQKDRHQYDGFGAPNGSKAYSYARFQELLLVNDARLAPAVAHGSMVFLME